MIVGARWRAASSSLVCPGTDSFSETSLDAV